MGHARNAGWLALALCLGTVAALGGCNRSEKSSADTGMTVDAANKNDFEIIPTPPPKDLEPGYNSGAGGGKEPGTVKCRVCPTYADVPQYDKNGRATGTKRVKVGTHSCDCGA